MKRKRLFIPFVKSVGKNASKNTEDKYSSRANSIDVPEKNDSRIEPVHERNTETLVDEKHIPKSDIVNDALKSPAVPKTENAVVGDAKSTKTELISTETKVETVETKSAQVESEPHEKLKEEVAKVEPPQKKSTEPERSFSNDTTNSKFAWSKKNNWLLVCASSIGQSHLQNNTPCQDNHFCETIGNGWGIAICSDGAGSAKLSHVGSKHVANEIGALYFKKLVTKNGWHKGNCLPTEQEWNIAVREGFKQIYSSLEQLAHSSSIELTALACTIIVTIYSPIGLLVAHIGDGRAGFLNQRGEWIATITPHKGEEANQTIFLTSEAWFKNKDFKMSNVAVPECRVISEVPLAFTLMTDGCETHSFECSKMDDDSNKWSDPNIPYSKFFNPLVGNIKAMHESNLSTEAMNEKWRMFVEKGTKGLHGEPDDKTMILGVLI